MEKIDSLAVNFPGTEKEFSGTKLVGGSPLDRLLVPAELHPIKRHISAIIVKADLHNPTVRLLLVDG